MPTLSDPARLRAEHFTELDLLDLSYAGDVFAAAIDDVSRHHIGDPGGWDCYGTGPEEVARLRAALDDVQRAIRDARAGLDAVERRVRRRATRRDSSARRDRRS
jgi:hypothetical protein